MRRANKRQKLIQKELKLLNKQAKLQKKYAKQAKQLSKIHKKAYRQKGGFLPFISFHKGRKNW